MTSILIVDRDAVVRAALSDAFERGTRASCLAIDPPRAAVALHGTHDSDGLIIRIDPDDPGHGWAMARRARGDNPGIVIGYLAAREDRDWPALGVPRSVLLDHRADAATIAMQFLRFCHAVRSVHAAVPDGRNAVSHDRHDQHDQTRIRILQNTLMHVSRLNALTLMAETIAHELSQPLTTISNHVAAARTNVLRVGESAQAIDSLEAAAKASLLAGDVIRNLQSLTRQRDTLRDRVPLDETLRDAAKIVMLGHPDVRITLDLPGPAIVLGDAVLIQQTVLNLAQNAIDAAAGGAVDIAITASDKGQVVEICVADTGPGIDRTVLPDAFEPFVTTRTAAPGIGLAMCKAIVEAQGGMITLRNGADRGAIACFTLPRGD